MSFRGDIWLHETVILRMDAGTREDLKLIAEQISAL